jgi:hypothetical protein
MTTTINSTPTLHDPKAWSFSCVCGTNAVLPGEVHHAMCSCDTRHVAPAANLHGVHPAHFQMYALPRGPSQRSIKEAAYQQGARDAAAQLKQLAATQQSQGLQDYEAAKLLAAAGRIVEYPGSQAPPLVHATDSAEMLAKRLFQDDLYEESFIRAELAAPGPRPSFGDMALKPEAKEKLRKTLAIMWKDPHYATIRARCETQAARMTARLTGQTVPASSTSLAAPKAKEGEWVKQGDGSYRVTYRQKFGLDKPLIQARISF